MSNWTLAQDMPLGNGFQLLFHTTSLDIMEPSGYGLKIGNTWNVYHLESSEITFGVRVNNQNDLPAQNKSRIGHLIFGNGRI